MDNLIEYLHKIYKDRRFPLAVAGIFIVLILYTIFNGVNIFVQHRETVKPVIHHQSSPTQTASTDLGTLHLFGQAPKPKEKLAETTLNIKLIGTLAMSPFNAGSAIISADGEEHAYGIGDAISENVNIKKIYPNRVILSRNGVDEVLILDTNLPSSDVIPETQQPNDSSKSVLNTEDLTKIHPEKFCDEYLKLSPDEQKAWRTEHTVGTQNEKTQQILKMLHQCFRK